MTSFIFDVLTALKNKKENFSTLTFVLPSKRAGVFLKHEISKLIEQPIFSPEIISIEDFVQELSQLKPISNTELLFEFYQTYCDLTQKEKQEPFDQFSKWAQVLLQDFNEIDRYLIPQEKIFNYLSAIQDLKHWSLDDNKTDFVKNYLSFWKKLYEYYSHFSERLLLKRIGYQGLIYREAVENIEAYIQNSSEKKHVFLGFNALNTAEENLIQELLQNDMAEIFWDIDTLFLENPIHDAALFARQHRLKWHYFKNNPFTWITNNYSKEKKISVFGIPKNIGQAKYIGNLLSKIKNENNSLNSTAVVLGDENLLIPVLNSLPISIDALNITMGFTLKSIPLASLFEQFFNLHKKPTKQHYYKSVVTILSHPFIRPLFVSENTDYASEIIDTIHENNLIYLSTEKLKSLAGEHASLIELLFDNSNASVDGALKNCSQLIFTIKTHLDKNKKANVLSLEYLYRFKELFNEITRLNSSYSYIKNIQTLHEIYKELLSSETLDFKGEPLEGLQIMGMLESRVLDFETVIISSVNEGVLPSGKSNNSFIPFDVKLENKLPTYKEKDAVYTYHFYRLLQRAKTVYILYNTEADILTAGEKSRFITQLELEGIHKIDHQIIAPIVPKIEDFLSIVKKDENIISKLKEVAKKGVSPSSLTTYIRNPIDFYNQKILGIKEYEDAEETIATNTLGTVVHNTLEDFYKPLEGSYLSVEIVENLKPNIKKTVEKHFKDVYKEGDITKGKNLIIYEIAKRYVSNFLDLEIAELNAGNQIKIIAIESNNTTPFDIPELRFPVFLTGKVDRVDEYNGITRIIDYKTGNVQQNQVEIINWEDITTDYDKFSKSFQVLSYVLMMHQSNKINLPVEAGIISFKNLNSGFLKFATKDRAGAYAKKEVLITIESLEAFQIELKKLILEICNPNVDFTEKEV